MSMHARARPDGWPGSSRRGSVPGRIHAAQLEAQRERSQLANMHGVASVGRVATHFVRGTGRLVAGAHDARGHTAKAEVKTRIGRQVNERKKNEKILSWGIDKRYILVYICIYRVI